jgi:hypothetical protein
MQSARSRDKRAASLMAQRWPSITALSKAGRRMRSNAAAALRSKHLSRRYRP